MGFGSSDNPYRESPFERIVEVGWSGATSFTYLQVRPRIPIIMETDVYPIVTCGAVLPMHYASNEAAPAVDYVSTIRINGRVDIDGADSGFVYELASRAFGPFELAVPLAPFLLDEINLQTVGLRGPRRWNVFDWSKGSIINPTDNICSRGYDPLIPDHYPIAVAFQCDIGTGYAYGLSLLSVYNHILKVVPATLNGDVFATWKVYLRPK